MSNADRGAEVDLADPQSANLRGVVTLLQNLIKRREAVLTLDIAWGQLLFVRTDIQQNNALTYIANGKESFTGQPFGIAIQM